MTKLAKRRYTRGLQARAQKDSQLLKDKAVSPAQNAKYRTAVAEFFGYLRQLTQAPASQSLQDPLEIDLAICDYLQFLWESERPKGDADALVCGIPHLIPPFQNSCMVLPGS